jgi:hypothetical protein
MKYLIPVLFVVFLSGCDNFLGTETYQESRASRPKPAEVNNELVNEPPNDSIVTSKAAPSYPANK